jgi:uncharacterized protein with von Willebrand factor type A (vWA) domain
VTASPPGGTPPRSPFAGTAVRDPLDALSGETFFWNTLLFTRALRSAGLQTDLTGAMDFARALTLVDIGDREAVHAAGMAIFVRRRDEIPVYDEVFSQFWRRHELRIKPTALDLELPRPATTREDAAQRSAEGAEREGRGPEGRREQAEPGSEDEGQAELAEGFVISPMAYSGREVMREKSFDRMSAVEFREAELLIDRLRPRLETRLTRRQELHPHGRSVAPRAMLRRNLKTGGHLVEWVWRRKVRRPRSIVVICDVSGSMERHSRLLLRFVQALARTSSVRTEAFVFGTHLTRVTHEIRGRNADEALERVAAAVTDWSGGTRIGESFRQFNLRWARRVLRTSGVVIVVSDGWDRGDPAVVRRETARLQRNCHRLIWLNPLAGVEGYQPLAAGMAAAYPSIDDFLPVHNLASLERLGELLGVMAVSRGLRPERTGRPRVHRLPSAPRAAAPRSAPTVTTTPTALPGAGPGRPDDSQPRPIT